jgi:hypothetical protein
VTLPNPIMAPVRFGGFVDHRGGQGGCNGRKNSGS